MPIYNRHPRPDYAHHCISLFEREWWGNTKRLTCCCFDVSARLLFVGILYIYLCLKLQPVKMTDKQTPMWWRQLLWCQFTAWWQLTPFQQLLLVPYQHPQVTGWHELHQSWFHRPDCHQSTYLSTKMNQEDGQQTVFIDCHWCTSSWKSYFILFFLLHLCLFKPKISLHVIEKHQLLLSINL